MDKVLVYAGPSLDMETIRQVLPEAIVMPPAKQGDLISHAMEYEPTHILLIDGLFHQSLSVWHKEIVWAMQIPGVQGVYGASSMGALRAADLANYGMIGCGKIFNWYFEGVITDEAEVANVYVEGRDGTFMTSTVPLVNVRGALWKALESKQIDDPDEAEEIFARVRLIHWQERTLRAIEALGFPKISTSILHVHDQKKIDALQLLHTFKELKKMEGYTRLGEDSLSQLFSAQFERDRSVLIGRRLVRLLDLSDFVSLHSEDYEQFAQNADYRVLALMLADIYRLGATEAEIDEEWRRWTLRMGLRSLQDHDHWLRRNHVNGRELVRLLSDEVRLRKLRKALMVRSGPRRQTQRLLDYLKLSRQYEFWANAACRHEELIAANGGEESLEFGSEADIAKMLSEHALRNGISVTTTPEIFAREQGFNSLRELMVCLSRDKLADS